MSLYYILYIIAIVLLLYDRLHYPLTLFELNYISDISDIIPPELLPQSDYFPISSHIISYLYKLFITICFMLPSPNFLFSRIYIVFIHCYCFLQSWRFFNNMSAKADNLTFSLPLRIFFLFNPYILFNLASLSPVSFIFSIALVLLGFWTRYSSQYIFNYFIIFFGVIISLIYYPFSIFMIFFLLFLLSEILFSRRPHNLTYFFHLVVYCVLCLIKLFFIVYYFPDFFSQSYIMSYINNENVISTRFSTIVLPYCRTYATNIWYHFDIELFHSSNFYIKILKMCIEKIFVLLISPSFSYYRFSESSVSQFLPRNFSVCIVSVLVFATYPNRLIGADFWVLLKKSRLFYATFLLFFVLFLSNIYVFFPSETHAVFSYILSTVFAFMVSSRIYKRYLFMYVFSIVFIIISLFYEYNLFTTFEILYDYPANRIFMMC